MFLQTNVTTSPPAFQPTNALTTRTLHSSQIRFSENVSNQYLTCPASSCFSDPSPSPTPGRKTFKADRTDPISRYYKVITVQADRRCQGLLRWRWESKEESNDRWGIKGSRAARGGMKWRRFGGSQRCRWTRIGISNWERLFYYSCIYVKASLTFPPNEDWVFPCVTFTFCTFLRVILKKLPCLEAKYFILSTNCLRSDCLML